MGMIAVIQIDYDDGSKFLVRTDKDGYQMKINALFAEKKREYLPGRSPQPIVTQTTIEEDVYLGIEQKRIKDRK